MGHRLTLKSNWKPISLDEIKLHPFSKIFSIEKDDIQLFSKTGNKSVTIETNLSSTDMFVALELALDCMSNLRWECHDFVENGFPFAFVLNILITKG